MCTNKTKMIQHKSTLIEIERHCYVCMLKCRLLSTIRNLFLFRHKELVRIFTQSVQVVIGRGGNNLLCYDSLVPRLLFRACMGTRLMLVKQKPSASLLCMCGDLIPRSSHWSLGMRLVHSTPTRLHTFLTAANA